MIDKSYCIPGNPADEYQLVNILARMVRHAICLSIDVDANNEGVGCSEVQEEVSDEQFESKEIPLILATDNHQDSKLSTPVLHTTLY